MGWASVVEATVGSCSSLSSSFFLVAEMDSATPIVVGMAVRARRPKTILARSRTR